MFKIGDKVKWWSSHTTKTGTIVAYVPAGGDPLTVFYKENLFEKGMRFNAYGGGSPRPELSYLVAVKKGKREDCLLQLYWPRVSALKPVTE